MSKKIFKGIPTTFINFCATRNVFTGKQQSAVPLPQLPARKYPELLRSCRVGPGGPASQFSENSAAQLEKGWQNSAAGVNSCRISGLLKKVGKVFLYSVTSYCSNPLKNVFL
jgi:hypothetical protein